ncbi:MAG: hypothetical protein ISN29_10770, partial [Gammaproteobacteria bacterium AqS3]|nr:hypothetical protein [Gammaproteobacteria bacterium AqS3]
MLPTSGSIQVPAGTLTVDEGRSGTFSVSLSAAPSRNAVISLAKTNSDVTLTPTSLTFTTSNWNIAQTVTVTVSQDAGATDDTDTITLSASGGITASSVTKAVSISDDDEAEQRTFINDCFSFDNEGRAVNECGQRLRAVIMGGTTSGTCGLSTNPSVVINPRLSSSGGYLGLANFLPAKICIHYENATHQAESGYESCPAVTTPDCGGGGSTIGDGGLTIVYPDLLDPSSGSIQVSPSGALNINEGASGNFSVRLSAAPTRNATISLAKTNSDITLSPASLTFTTANWSTAQSVTVTAAQDTDAIDDTDSITLSASGGITASSVTKAVSIDDDETAGLTLSTTSLNVDEDDSADFMVRLTGQPLDDVTVRLAQPTDGTANADVTFDPTSLTFTTANWNTDQPVTVRAADDADAGDDTATIDLTASGGGYAGITGSVTITVRDDDDIDGVPANFNPVTLAGIAATEGSAIARRIALSRRPSAGVTVALASDNSDVTFASDAAGSTAITSLSFTRANWNTAQTFYTVLGDDSDTDNDTAEVTLSASGGDFAGVTASYGVTVIDTGKPNIVPSRSPVVVDEDDSAVTVGVRLSEQPRFTGTFQFNVNLTITSSDPSVFTVAPSSLVFDSHDNQGLIWSDDQDLTITPVDDGTFTGAVKNATINIVASRDDNYRENYRTSDGTLTIPVQVRDDDPPPELILSPASLTVAEDGDEDFTVRLKTQPSASVTVTLVQPTNIDVTVDDTSLTFTTGNWDQTQTVKVSAADDDDALVDTATIKLTAAGGGYDNVEGSVSVSVTENDSAGLDISESSIEIDEDDEATFTVVLTSEPSATVKVTLAQPDDSTNDDVTIDTDTAASGDQSELTFTTSNWSTAQTVTVSAVDDDDGDDDTATINLTAAGGDYENKTGSVSVAVDDDDGFELSETDGMLDVDEGEEETFTVRLTSQPSANVTVTLAQTGTTNTDVTFDTDNDDSNGDQSTLTFTTGNWEDPQTVTVRAASDGDTDDDSATIRLTASGGGYSRVTGSLDVSVEDDDEVELNVSMSTLTVTEGSDNTFTVALDSQPSDEVTVRLARTGASSTDVTFDTDDKTAGNQDELTFTTTDWGPKTVTISAAEDSDTDNDMATINLSAEGGGYDGKTASVTVTVTDDDGRFDLMPASLTVAEGRSKTFTVALTSEPSDNVTVTLVQTGTTNSDITVDTDSATTGNQDELTFTTTDWDDPQTVTVNAAEDADAVVDTATIEVSTSGDSYGNFKSSLMVTVTETDTAGFKLLDSGDDTELTGLKVTEGNRATFRVRLASEPSESVTVTLASSNSDVTFDTDGSTAGNQDELTFTADNWDDPEPV